MKTKDIGIIGEKLVKEIIEKYLAVAETKNSGQTHGDGDLHTDMFCVEVKTSNKTVSLSKARWNKVKNQALQSRRIPLLVSVLLDESSPVVLATIPLEQLMEMWCADEEISE